MYLDFPHVSLKSGESVQAGVIVSPDSQWLPALQTLLAHKGEPWLWQVQELLTAQTGVEAYFHVLHRGGIPFSHILTVEKGGVGVLGHVWTNPGDRGQGAASQLMRLQMEYSRSRGVRALYLSTGYDSPAYHIYCKHGFQSVEPQSGVMAFFTSSQKEFEDEYFAPGQAEVQTLNWSHWATGSALFAGELPGIVRIAPLNLLGRALTEGPLMPVLHEQHLRGEERETHVVALQKSENGALVGLAVQSGHALWPDVCAVDVYCHPHFWRCAAELLNSLPFSGTCRVVAYAEESFAEKARVLEIAGFHRLATLPQWVAVDAAKTRFVDVALWQRD